MPLSPENDPWNSSCLYKMLVQDAWEHKNRGTDLNSSNPHLDTAHHNGSQDTYENKSDQRRLRWRSRRHKTDTVTYGLSQERACQDVTCVCVGQLRLENSLVL